MNSLGLLSLMLSSEIDCRSPLGIAKTLRVLESRVSGRVVKYPVGSGRVSGLTYVVKNM